MSARVVARVMDGASGRRPPAGAYETVRLSLDGVYYEVELSHSRARKLRAELRPYIAAARPIARRRGAGRLIDGSGAKAVGA